MMHQVHTHIPTLADTCLGLCRLLSSPFRVDLITTTVFYSPHSVLDLEGGHWQDCPLGTLSCERLAALSFLPQQEVLHIPQLRDTIAPARISFLDFPLPSLIYHPGLVRFASR